MKIFFLTIFLMISSVNIHAETCRNDNFRKLQQEAKSLAGSVDNFNQRINLMLQIYKDSKGKFLFPLVALHGAKWGRNFMKHSEVVIESTAVVIPLRHTSSYRKIKVLSEGLKNINKKVFIDLYSHFYFAKRNPECMGKSISLSNKKLLELIYEIISKNYVSNFEKIEDFKKALSYEQEFIVSPLIKKLKRKLKLNRTERYLFLRPIVRFSYFPYFTYFQFKNFFDQNERIEKAIRSAEIALSVGEGKVIESIY